LTVSQTVWVWYVVIVSAVAVVGALVDPCTGLEKIESLVLALSLRV